MRVSVRHWGGGVETRAGGTRTDLKMGRLWQQETPFPELCPFETKPQTVLAHHDNGKNGVWRVLNNLRTPFQYHRLIVPEKCWSTDEIRILGGQGKIAAVIDIASGMIRRENGGEIWLGVHVGSSAGQNLRHLHYHLLRPMIVERSLISMGGKLSFAQLESQISKLADDSSLFVFEESGMSAFVGGTRAGQCFITPVGEAGGTDPIDVGADLSIRLSTALYRLITLCNERFKNAAGLPPEYMAWLVFHEGEFCFGCYLPILNHPGFTEMMAMLAPQRYPMILPWTHEKTAAHLRGEER